VDHRTARKLVGLLVAVACSVSSIVLPARAQTIASINVTASSLAVGAVNVSYSFNFALPSGLTASEAVTLTFAAGFDVSRVTQSTVTCYGSLGWSGSVDSVNVSGQNVIISASSGFANYEPITITLLQASQITNPSIASVYSLSVSSPRDTGSASVTIGGSGGSGGGTGVGGVTSVSATANPNNAGKAAEYFVSFVTGSEAFLIGGVDWVDVQFPAGATVPASIASGSILMKMYPVTSIQVSGTRLRLGVPESLGFIAGGASDCTIVIPLSVGILHPEIPGTYVVQVATSKQPNYSSSSGYSVVGTAVLNASAVVTPARQGMAAQYQLTFTSSTSGALTAGSGRINVEFPAGTTIPASLPTSGVLVNDVPASSVLAVATNRIAVTVAGAIAGGSTIRVVFGIDLGIRNPSIVGTYQLGISTSGDATPVPVSYAVSSSQIGTVTAQVSNGAAGQVTAYTISFTTGPAGALAPGIDRINVEFPGGTTIPVTIAASSVTINGAPSTLVTTAGMILSATVPASIGANAPVSLILGDTAGIMNPVTGGTYSLQVSTSRETVAVTSTGYAVSSLPVVRAALMPATPDGLMGYYRTKPAITLSAQSAVDAQPVISYRFDSNPDSVYSGQPLMALEGIHTLSYYAIDSLGSRSATGTLTIAVDTTPPVIAVLEPQNGATLNGQTFAVRGTTDVGSAVTVNGLSAVVDATGAFNHTVTIPGTTATIVVDARDPAGNTSQQSIQVSVDKVPPTLTLSQPVNFQKIQRLPIVVTGKTEAGAVVTVQGSPATVLADGSFDYSIASATDGPLTITVIARDPAGNATTRTIAVTILSTKIIQMQVGAKAALVNGQSIALQTAPVIQNGRTMVPLRFIAETFGITPVWDGVFQIIDLPIGTGTIRLQIGQRFAAVDGKRVALDAAPVILGGVTMVPLRFIADTLGADTQWEAATRTIMIVYPKAS
jgi:hypothetical protein